MKANGFQHARAREEKSFTTSTSGSRLALMMVREKEVWCCHEEKKLNSAFARLNKSTAAG